MNKPETAQQAGQLGERAIRAVEQLTKLWWTEDADACAPSASHDGQPSGTGPSNPTHAIATRQAKFKDRDRIGGVLASTVERLEREVERRQSRKPTVHCWCCNDHMATHDEGLCWWCWSFRTRNGGQGCGDETHKDRPQQVEFCQCPPQCCDPCPDRPSESRTGRQKDKKPLSDRCATRRARGHWGAAA